MNRILIETKLPSLNEVVSKNRANRYMGATMKRQVQELIGWYIKLAQKRGEVHPVEECEISITWHERTKRRDVDNIQSAQKFILDAMVEQKLLPDDSRKYVKQIYHLVVDDDEDFVEVVIDDSERSEGETGSDPISPE